MRYYTITVTNPDSGAVYAQWTSYINGVTDLGALDIQFDILVPDQAIPSSNFMVIIFGIPLQLISQAFNFNGMNITISAGFKKGLPLANPAQAGVIAQGNIVQAFGNWIGVDMTLNFMCNPGLAGTATAATAQGNILPTAQQAKAQSPASPPPTGTLDSPMNGSFLWPKGSDLSDVLKNFFATALPNFKLAISINPNLKAPNVQAGVYPTLRAFAGWLLGYTKSLIGGSYPGVSLRIDSGNTIVVDDGTSVGQTTNIAFQELIGQPTWIAPLQIQFKCPMRSDIKVNDNIVLPKGIFPSISPISNPETPNNYRDQSAQQGTFKVIEVHHFGRFRQATADSWATLITCAFIPNTSA